MQGRQDPASDGRVFQFLRRVKKNVQPPGATISTDLHRGVETDESSVDAGHLGHGNDGRMSRRRTGTGGRGSIQHTPKAEAPNPNHTDLWDPVHRPK